MISCSKQANSSWVLWPWLCWLEVVSKLQCVIIGAFSSSDFDCNDFLANLTLVTGVSFKDGSSNLSLWEASLGSSYMCKKEQSFNITENLILNTFELQVQPFGVMNDQFNTGKIQPFIKTCLKLFKKKNFKSWLCRDIPFYSSLPCLWLNVWFLCWCEIAALLCIFSLLAAHECSVDDTSLLIPIIVGAALAVLILIVVIAYVIGRRKTYVGYQTL